MAKTNYDLSKQMQNALIKAYCKACDGAWTMHDACLKAVRSPAPRFYVSAKQAYQVISPMVRGNFDRLKHYNPLKRQMYYELFQVVMRLSEKPEFIGKSLWYIMPFAVIQPASQFFLSPHTLYCIRHDLKKGRISEDGKQSPHVSKGKRKKKKRK